MKIALIILNSDPSRGGAERYTIDLAEALVARGHEVAVLSGDRENSDESEEPTGAGYLNVKLPMRGFTRSQKYLCFERTARRWLENNHHELVHAMLPFSNCDIYHPHAGFAIDALRGKPIQTFFNPRRRLFAAVERKLLSRKYPPLVICVSNLVKNECLQSYPSLPAARLERLFNAVDLKRFTPPTNRMITKPVEALLVAQSFKLKGVATAIQALPHAPDVTLTVVGRDNPSRYRKMAQTLKVADRVKFVGVQLDMTSFYQHAGFLVLPTFRDTSSLVVLEALACGLPVITTRFAGACEIMRDGEHGFILDEANDAQKLAAAMNRLIEPEVRMEMESNCIQLRSQLAYEHHLGALISIYERARDRKHPIPT